MFGTLGCRPRARSALHCHGALVLRQRPWTRGVPDERHQHDAASTLEAGSAERHAASNLEAGSAERQVKARFAAIF